MTSEGPRQRTVCPECSREVSFMTDLAYKYLRLHKRPGGREWCRVRAVEVGA